jgi:hypothetical protein
MTAPSVSPIKDIDRHYANYVGSFNADVKKNLFSGSPTASSAFSRSSIGPSNTKPPEPKPVSPVTTPK